MPTAGERCEHVTESIKTILALVNGTSEQAFLTNPIVQDACYYRFVIIGEAAGHLCRECPGEIARLASQAPDLAAALSCAHKLRTVLTHRYYRADPKIVWATIEKDLPQLSTDIAMLRSLLP